MQSIPAPPAILGQTFPFHVTSPIITSEYPRYQHEQVMTCQMKISEVSRKKHKDDHSPNSLSLSLSLSHVISKLFVCVVLYEV